MASCPFLVIHHAMLLDQQLECMFFLYSCCWLCDFVFISFDMFVVSIQLLTDRYAHVIENEFCDEIKVRA